MQGVPPVSPPGQGMVSASPGQAQLFNGTGSGQSSSHANPNTPSNPIPVDPVKRGITSLYSAIEMEEQTDIINTRKRQKRSPKPKPVPIYPLPPVDEAPDLSSPG